MSDDLLSLPEPALYARLAVLVPARSPDDWRRVLGLPEPWRTESLRAWAEEDSDWVQRPDRFAQVLAVVSAIVAVAGGLGTVASAVGAVRALRP